MRFHFRLEDIANESLPACGVHSLEIMLSLEQYCPGYPNDQILGSVSTGEVYCLLGF